MVRIRQKNERALAYLARVLEEKRGRETQVYVKVGLRLGLGLGLGLGDGRKMNVPWLTSRAY